MNKTDMHNKDLSHKDKNMSGQSDHEETLIAKYQALNSLFQQVETAKKEWEKTMDCVGDMIILTDDEGKIKRVNHMVRKFTEKPYEEILGKNWEDLIIEHGLEATKLYAGCTELVHKQSCRCF